MKSIKFIQALAVILFLAWFAKGMVKQYSNEPEVQVPYEVRMEMHNAEEKAEKRDEAWYKYTRYRYEQAYDAAKKGFPHATEAYWNLCASQALRNVCNRYDGGRLSGWEGIVK